MWRYRELLPVDREENIVSLGHGFTPLIKLERISRGLGLEVYLKDKGRNPTVWDLWPCQQLGMLGHWMLSTIAGVPQ